MHPPVITFVSDYGLDDDFVGVCHGVIHAICPQARVIDLTHGVRRHDIGGGALILRQAIPYMPVGIHLAVVDPDVGAKRRAVALEVGDGRILVGPDNGLLWPAAQAAGGVVDAVDIASSPFRLEPVSATFHGRDIFAPVAAHLAAGASLQEAGEACDSDLLVRWLESRPTRRDGVLVSHALYVDRFGNVQLDVAHEDIRSSGLKLGTAVVLELPSGRSHDATYVRTFADVAPEQLIVYEDAYRRLAVAVSNGNAAEQLGVRIGEELRIRPQ
jgi:S-adenosylmethionine hydrolase